MNQHVDRRTTVDVELTETPAMQLYREWQAASRICEGDMDADERWDFISKIMIPLEERLAATPAKTMQDLAAKLYVLVEYDEGPLADEIDALIAGASPTLEEPAESPILILFREFEASYDKAAAADEDEAEALWSHCTILEKRMIDLPATSAADFAAKILAFTRYGDFTLGEGEDAPLVAEAKALVAGASPTLDEQIADRHWEQMEAAACADGSTPTATPPLLELIDDYHRVMLEWVECDDEAWDELRAEIGSRVDAARAALLAHRPRSLVEVRDKASFMAGARAFVEWDDVDVQQVIRSLSPI